MSRYKKEAGGGGKPNKMYVTCQRREKDHHDFVWGRERLKSSFVRSNGIEEGRKDGRGKKMTNTSREELCRFSVLPGDPSVEEEEEEFHDDVWGERKRMKECFILFPSFRIQRGKDEIPTNDFHSDHHQPKKVKADSLTWLNVYDFLLLGREREGSFLLKEELFHLFPFSFGGRKWQRMELGVRELKEPSKQRKRFDFDFLFWFLFCSRYRCCWRDNLFLHSSQTKEQFQFKSKWPPSPNPSSLFLVFLHGSLLLSPDSPSLFLSLSLYSSLSNRQSLWYFSLLFFPHVHVAPVHLERCPPVWFFVERSMNSLMVPPPPPDLTSIT